MGELKILTSYNTEELIAKIPAHMRTPGDTKIMYDPKNEDEVEIAEEQFNALIDKGFKAYKVKKDGEKGVAVKVFKPSEGKYILVPPIVGG